LFQRPFLIDVPLSRLIQPLKKYSSTGEINMRIENRKAVFSALEAKYHDSRRDHLDGLTVEYDSWWFNLRASNTEPPQYRPKETL
jgi:phosphomannomutase